MGFVVLAVGAAAVRGGCGLYLCCVTRALSHSLEHRSSTMLFYRSVFGENRVRILSCGAQQCAVVLGLAAHHHMIYEPARRVCC